MISSCSVIVRKPLGQEPSTLGIRAAWAMMANSGIEVSVILMGDGIYSVLGKSGYIRDLYRKFLDENGTVYAVTEDMEARGIEADQLPEGIEPLAAADVYGIVDDTDSIMTF